MSCEAPSSPSEAIRPELDNGEDQGDEEDQVDQGAQLEQVRERPHEVGDVLALGDGDVPKVPAGAMSPDPYRDQEEREEELDSSQFVDLDPARDDRHEAEQADAQHEQPDEAHLRAQVSDDRV